MTTVTPQYSTSEEFNLEKTLKFLINKVINDCVNLVNSGYNLVLKAFGYLGIIILAPVFILVSFILVILLKFSNYKMRNAFEKLFSMANNASQRDVMMLHFEVKKRRMASDEVLERTKPSSHFLFFKFLYDNIMVSQRIFKDAEDRLHKTAYPHLYQKLTSEQQDQLRKLNLEWEGVWEDDDVCISR